MLDNLLQKNTEDNLIPSGQKWWLPIILTTIFVLVVLILGTGLMTFEIYYNDKFFPGSKIGDLNLSGLTKDQAFVLLEQRINKIDKDNLKLQYQDNNQIKNTIISNTTNPEISLDFFTYDLYQSVYNNFNQGRNGGLITNIVNQIIILVGKKEFIMVYKADYDYVLRSIKGEVGGLEVKESNATPNIKCVNDVCQIDILVEKSGLSFNYDSAIKKWENDLSKLNNNTIKLDRIITQPEITKTESENSVYKINSLLAASSSPEFYYQDKKYQINKKTLATMVIFYILNKEIKVGINKDIFLDWFNKVIAKDLDVEAKNATLQLKDGKISSLSAHQNGLKTNSEKAFNDLNDKLLNNDFSNLRFQLAVEQVIPEVSTESVNDLGVGEILGTGESNFAGSPTNRIKNIKNGASKLHGRLIKPGEEFSLIQTLLPVDATNGYFTELVIKGNKTTPEYGGGLCQVGTTLFRAVLASGLPVLERQNHSYSVTYYLENGLPGVDATIYDPKPDFRFKNDTENYLLIQSRIEGTKLYFDFWGTKDGRVASRTKPKTWGLRKPEPTKLIETTDLKPGEKKCTESSHNGISASFNYIVAYGDGKTVTSTFTSVYKPWQAVCLVGVSSLTTASTTNTTSTIDN